MADRDSTDDRDEFTRHRDSRDAARYRRLQAAALLKLFRSDVGRPPRDMDELTLWAGISGKAPRPVNPYEVLTDEEIRTTLGGG